METNQKEKKKYLKKTQKTHKHECLNTKKGRAYNIFFEKWYKKYFV